MHRTTRVRFVSFSMFAGSAAVMYSFVAFLAVMWTRLVNGSTMAARFELTGAFRVHAARQLLDCLSGGVVDSDTIERVRTDRAVRALGACGSSSSLSSSSSGVRITNRRAVFNTNFFKSRSSYYTVD